jgi:aspergillopepsin I
MFGSSILVFGLALIGFVHTAPSKIYKRTFSVTKPHNVEENQFDGAWALKKAYLRHGLPLPRGLEKRQIPASPKVVASVAATTESNDLEYLSPIEVGGVQMNLDFDTGSSDL